MSITWFKSLLLATEVRREMSRPTAAFLHPLLERLDRAPETVLAELAGTRSRSARPRSRTRWRHTVQLLLELRVGGEVPCHATIIARPARSSTGSGREEQPAGPQHELRILDHLLHGQAGAGGGAGPVAGRPAPGSACGRRASCAAPAAATCTPTKTISSSRTVVSASPARSPVLTRVSGDGGRVKAIATYGVCRPWCTRPRTSARCPRSDIP